MKDNEIKLLRTKAGKGFKVVVGNDWFYTSSGEMFKMMSGKAHAVVFRGITDKPQTIESEQATQQEQLSTLVEEEAKPIEIVPDVMEAMHIQAWEEQLKALELKDLQEITQTA